MLLTACFAAICLLGTLVAVGVAVRDEDGTAGASGAVSEYDVELGDLYVKPSSIEVPAKPERAA